jgi:hypothetical protein
LPQSIIRRAILKLDNPGQPLRIAPATPHQARPAGHLTFLNGTLVSNIVIATRQVATDTIDYVATDEDGLTATSTRTILIEPATTATSSVQ